MTTDKQNALRDQAGDTPRAVISTDVALMSGGLGLSSLRAALAAGLILTGCGQAGHEQTTRTVVPGRPPAVTSAPMPRRLTVNREAPGLSGSAGYDFPDADAGTKVHPEGDDAVVYPIARTRDDRWLLVQSPKAGQPVWMPADAVTFPDRGELSGLPVLAALPSTETRVPADFKPGKVINGKAHDHADAFSRPGREGPVACKLALGAGVRALALLPSDQQLDVLVEADGCPGRVWMWKIDADWEGFNFWEIKPGVLSVIQPRVLGRIVLPEIAPGPQRVRMAMPVPAPGRRPTVFVVDTLARPHAWAASVPERHRATRADLADFLVEVQKVFVEEQSCSYIPYGRFRRIRHDSLLSLVSKDSSKLLAQTTLRGAPAPSCPQSLTQGDPSTGVGSAGSGEGLGPWLDRVLGGRT